MTLAERRRLLVLAELKVAPGGAVALLVTSPRIWQDAVGPVVADLAPAGPWHAATWAYLLAQMGFADVSSVAGPVTGGLGRADTGDATAAALNRALELIEPLVCGPETFCVIGTKRQPGAKSTVGR
jgi:hypothetical protein